MPPLVRSRLFQFYLSSIKSLYNFKSRCISSQFQFYLSSIKRLGYKQDIWSSDKFQFYLSSIKRICISFNILHKAKVSILP